MKQFFTFLGIIAMGATAYGQADTDIVHIPDANFKKALLENYIRIDKNGDKEISYGEAKGYKEHLNVSYKNISDLTGIKVFENIKGLDCSNNELQKLDVSGLSSLMTLNCLNNNQLTHIDISNTKVYIFGYDRKVLKHLDISNNKFITKLDVSKGVLIDLNINGTIALQELICFDNQLTKLDLSETPNLMYLSCNNNKLTDLDLSDNLKLIYLQCQNNQLVNINIKNNTKLSYFNCSYNQLTSLDLSSNTDLYRLYCSNNQLTQLNLANGNSRNLYDMMAYNNVNLKCIQTDGVRGNVELGSNWKKDSHSLYSTNCNYPTLSTTDEVKTENHLQILNPVKDNLVIKTTAKVERVEIYNTAGQLVKVLFKGNTAVQDLAKGIYLIKITTDQGVITEKIIKQ